MTSFPGDDPFADTKIGNALTRAIVETIHEPFLVLDIDLRIIVASRSFYEKFKTTREETQGHLLYDIAGGMYNIPALRHFLKNIIPEHAVLKEYKIVHDFIDIGQRTMLLSAREVLYENSNYKHLLLTIGDISGQELLEKEKEKLLRQKDIMILEMKHRMANSLQLIASILILKSEAIKSPEVRLHLHDAHERIMSIATIEQQLDTTGLSEEVEVGPYLQGLCESLTKSMIRSARPITLHVDAQGGMTTSAIAISLGLITAELVINCLKHAFPAETAGTITVTYTCTGQTHWSLTVEDDGVGVSPDAKRKGGLGTSIIQSLAHQLGATVEMRTGPLGTTIMIEHKPKQLA